MMVVSPVVRVLMPPCCGVDRGGFPDAGETAIINGNNSQRYTFKTGTSVGELRTAEPNNQ
jgi:hypothetical protein